MRAVVDRNQGKITDHNRVSQVKSQGITGMNRISFCRADVAWATDSRARKSKHSISLFLRCAPTVKSEQIAGRTILSDNAI